MFVYKILLCGPISTKLTSQFLKIGGSPPSGAGFNLIRLFFVEFFGSMDRTVGGIPWNFFLKKLVVPE